MLALYGAHPKIAKAAPEGATSMHTAPVLEQAWKRYQATADDMRKLVETSPQYIAVPEQRAKAYHTLMEMQAMAYNFAVAPRLMYPRIYYNLGWQNETYTLGGNSGDFHYAQLFLDGAQTYKLTVDMRDSQVVLAQLNSHLSGGPGSQTIGNYDFIDFKPNANGKYEVMISASEQKGNWIKLDPKSDYQWIQFRPTMETWADVPADIRVERISPGPADRYAGQNSDPAQVAKRIDMATDFTRYIMTEWTREFYPRTLANAGGINKFGVLGKKISGEVGSPTAEYVMGVFEAGPDEALIVELPDVPGGAYWSLQLFDVWLRSLEFRTRQTQLSGKQIVPSADGRVRLVLSQRDPGIANWLDSSDYDTGMILLRNYRTRRSTMPTLKRVKFSELASYLSPNEKRVTAEERSRELEARRLAYLKRYSE
jgi:hypothetical protein